MSAPRNIELRVGLFVLVGLAIIAAMVVRFGRSGEGISGSYTIVAKFADASGLLRGADVLMSGARIGSVAADPSLLAAEPGVKVPLRIREGTRIPANSTFRIGTSGLLGDRFVQVFMGRPEKDRPQTLLAPGAEVTGERETSLGDLATNGDELMRELKVSLTEMRATLQKIDEGILQKPNVEAFTSALRNLEKTSGELARFSEGFGEMGEDAKAALSGFRDAAERFAKLARSADEGEGILPTLLDDRETAENFKGALADLASLADRVDRLAQKAERGEGALSLLLGDRQVAADLRDLVANLRRHGVLFYRDSAARAAQRHTSPQEAPLRSGRASPSR